MAVRMAHGALWATVAKAAMGSTAPSLGGAAQAAIPVQGRSPVPPMKGAGVSRRACHIRTAP